MALSSSPIVICIIYISILLASSVKETKPYCTKHNKNKTLFCTNSMFQTQLFPADFSELPRAPMFCTKRLPIKMPAQIYWPCLFVCFVFFTNSRGENGVWLQCLILWTLWRNEGRFNICKETDGTNCVLDSSFCIFD